MLANLLSVAGVNHVITVDLHVGVLSFLLKAHNSYEIQAPPMQGFFGKPVDNLYAEPVIARWIRMHVKEWRDAVVVSKNPGGSKRVTSLADALKLSFAIITTDRRRSPPGGSTILDSSMILGDIGKGSKPKDEKMGSPREHRSDTENANGMQSCPGSRGSPKLWGNNNGVSNLTPISPVLSRHSQPPFGNSPLQQSSRVESESPPSRISLPRSESPLSAPRDSEQTPSGEEYTDERAREVITGRFVQGHIVDDDFPSPMLSTMSGSVANLASLGPSQFEDRDPMTSSLMSAASSAHLDSGLGEKFKPNELSDEEDEGLKNPEVEHTVTLVGDVRGKTVIIIDDIMDGCESWIAAAETVVKRGGATKVYCIATHGLFGEGSLERLEDCDCINHILVCNTFPLDPQRSCYTKKLEILDLSGMLSEAIRRNHHGESITQLYQQYVD